ncbi:MAG TPA: FecR domain-containing protein [Rhizomicrobium sp.]|nr:FecR domain-containing protein [Rhizomicrobium sp.]
MSNDTQAAAQTLSHDAIEQRAAEFLIAHLHDPDWTAQKQAELDAWLAESVDHEVAYLRLEAGWNGADRLSILRAAPPLPVRSSPRFEGNKRFHAAAVVLLCAGIGGAIYATDKQPQDQVFATPVGGRESITLADGSQIELNTNTELRLPQGSRQAVLVKGEAYFQIKHDPAKPFTLDAGDHRVIDLGTKFVVRRKETRLEVTLVEGSARVETAPGSAHPQSAVLAPGDVAVATNDDLKVTRKPAAMLADTLSWRSGFVTFHHTTLSQAAAELNRYNSEQIVITDDAAAHRVFGGKFRTTDSERFADVAGTALGLHVEHRGNDIVISGK